MRTTAQTSGATIKLFTNLWFFISTSEFHFRAMTGIIPSFTAQQETHPKPTVRRADASHHQPSRGNGIHCRTGPCVWTACSQARSNRHQALVECASQEDIWAFLRLIISV